jgi:pimeloyl-ACP methyl ester carboxylesterase
MTTVCQQPAKLPDTKPMVGRLRFHFKNPVIGGYFSYVLAFASRVGGDVGAVFQAASQIRERDAESWVSAFTQLAERVSQLADSALAQGHRLSARQHYLHASIYDRAALFMLSPVQHTERYRDIYHRSRDRFRKAAALFDPPVEPIEIPFAGKMMRGYFMKPDNDDTQRPTLIIVGGGDSVVEDMCYVWGLGDNERGYNFLTVDLPGQGATALEGLTLRPDMEVPMQAVIDYALKRPEVDPARLAMWGGSLGGYIVPRVASVDRRIKAIGVCSIILDMNAYLTQAKEMTHLARLELMPGFKLLSRLLNTWIGGVFSVLDTWKWKWGVQTVAEWLEVCRQYTVDPAGIRCPTLLQVGEDELTFPESRRFHEEALARIGHPHKTLLIGRTDIGAGAKNMLPNLTMIRQTMFDWLDEVFSQDTEDAFSNAHSYPIRKPTDNQYRRN